MADLAWGGATRAAGGRDAPGASRGATGRRVRREGVERVVAGLLVASSLALLAAAAFLVVPPLFRITRVEVLGLSTLTRAEVLSASLLRPSDSFFSVEPARVRAALLAEPRVRDAAVERLFPNGLRLVVTERRAAVRALVTEGGRVRLVEIDEEGVAFAAVPASASQAGSAPLLSGLRFEDWRAGTRLPRELVPVVACLGRVRASAPALLEAFSEIRVVRTAWGELELLLYPISYRVPVRADSGLDEETLRSMILVLDVLGSRVPAGSVEEIDFRAGTVVYRAKEGQPG